MLLATLALAGCSASTPTAGHSAQTTMPTLPGATTTGPSTPTPPGPTSTDSTSTAAVGTGMLTLTVEPDDGYRSVDQLIASARHTIDMTMYELADTQAQGLLIAARQ
ncbi:MAG TPA: hypothetical protein VFC03_18370 [Acidimicrobiales bacterium]|nr:hypothetical protein [Acidimicrobiales bacterium]